MSATFGPDLIIETERFQLRPLTIEDVGADYVAWLNDSEVTRWTASAGRSHSLETAQAYVARHDNAASYHLGIFVRADGRHIGNFSVRIDHYHKVAEINVLVGDKRWWGARVVLEARAAVIDWLFNSMDMHKIIGTPFSVNAPAIFNYQVHGFVLEGVLRSHRLIGNGNRVDVLNMALFRPAWELKRGGRANNAR